jgi:hypothetical protein
VFHASVPTGTPGSYAEPRERHGEPLHAGMRPRVGVAEDVALELARHDLGLAVVFRRILDEAGHEQRQVHHQAAHAFPHSVTGALTSPLNAR